jgi:hypothetical protein
MAKRSPVTELWIIEVFRLKGHDGVGTIVAKWPINATSIQAKALVNGMVRQFHPKNGDAVRLLNKDGEEKHRRTWWDEQKRAQTKFEAAAKKRRKAGAKR